MIKKIRTENHSTLEFQPADKLGFSTETVDDYNIQQSLADLKGFANAGQLLAIPANATAEDLRDATYEVMGAQETIDALTANMAEVSAVREAGGLIYHVLPSFTRVFEQGDGKGRVGRKRAAFAGLGDAPESDSPLV